MENANRGEFRLKCRQNFLKKSIMQMKRVLAEELLTEHYASRDGLLQQMDPRIKLISAVVLIILTGLTRSIYALLGMWAFTILLILLSRLPLLTLQKRIWGLIPLLTLLASIPAMLNIVIDGTPLLMIHQATYPSTWLGINIPADIYISKQGVTAALFLFLRVGLSLSMGILLTMTTPIAKLLKSLQVMGVPSLFVMIIEMSYRYLVLLLNLSIEMFEARSLRTVGVLSLASRRAQVGSSIAALFARSMDLADEVYLAM
ncbi:MAG: cobalt ECF transporter T component CbiQ, partial [Syntrophomonas sp.]|nr:cobalt ECF transporter T component CbiQ [Syntrophomonas sp.]